MHHLGGQKLYHELCKVSSLVTFARGSAGGSAISALAASSSSVESEEL